MNSYSYLRQYSNRTITQDGNGNGCGFILKRRFIPNLTTNDRPQAEVPILPSLSVMKHFTKPEVSTTCGFSMGLYGCGFTSHGSTPKARKFLSGKWAQKKKFARRGERVNIESEINIKVWD